MALGHTTIYGERLHVGNVAGFLLHIISRTLTGKITRIRRTAVREKSVTDQRKSVQKWSIS